MKLTDVLRGGKQCDEDGVEIIMSRQACVEAADEIDSLRYLLEQCYVKLMKFGVENSDPLLMDELKLTLMQCYNEPAGLTG